MEEEISLREVMLKASTMMIVTLIAGKALGYAFHFISVRLFAQAEYGSFVYAWSWGLFLCGLLIPNIAASMTRYVAYYRGKSEPNGVGSTVRTGIVLNSALIVPALTVSFLAYASGLIGVDWATFLFIASVLVINAYSGLFSGIISGYRRPEVSQIFNVLQQVLRVLAVVVAAYFAASVYGLMGFVAVAFLLYLAALVYYEWGAYGFGSNFDWRLSGELLRFGVFTIFFTTANNLLAWFGIFLIGGYMGAEAVAVYNIAWLGSTLNLVFFTSVLQIFNPVAAELYAAKKTKKLVNLTSYLLESFFLLFLPIFMVMVLFAKEVISLFFTSQYAAGALPLQILSVGAFFTGISMLFIELVMAEGKPQINARNFGVGALVNGALNFLLIPQYGLVGAAVSSLASSILILALSYSHVKPFVRPAFSARRIVKMIVASSAGAAAAAAVRFLPQMNVRLLLAFSCAVFLIVYLSALLAFRALRAEDLSLFSAALERMKAPSWVIRSASCVLKVGLPRKSAA